MLLEEGKMLGGPQLRGSFSCPPEGVLDLSQLLLCLLARLRVSGVCAGPQVVVGFLTSEL